MARKSRKPQASDLLLPEQKAICAALYIRLSIEDNQSGSSSIETQKLILNRYIDSVPEIFVYDTYIDNGATGTNFHRPDFQRMLADVEAGLINCIIVKDLSRLGRNAIDTGYYIEQYFPAHNVRFIAINDQYDSNDPDSAHSGILIPLKNMINEAYALDIGKKIKAQQRQAMKDGDFIGSRPPYGYLKAPDNCHRLVINPETAPVVKQMFEWAAAGESITGITRRLNKAGIATPGSYQKHIRDTSEKSTAADTGIWQSRTINRILRLETYTGCLVQGHTKMIDHKQVKADADNLIKVSNTHEGIISKELFLEVQSILANTALKCGMSNVSANTPNPLKGKVFCAHCGGSLHRQKKSRKLSDDVYYYCCISNNRVASGCIGAYIREEPLLTALVDILQRQLEATLGEYSLLLPTEDEQNMHLSELSSQYGESQQAVLEYRSRIRGLYENYVQGLITSEEYSEFKRRYEERISVHEQEASRLDKERKLLLLKQARQKALTLDLNLLKTNPTLTSDLISRLIERIDVSDTKHFEVRFLFQDEFADIKEALSKCANI